MDGLYESWDHHGNLLTSCIYMNGLLEGVYAEWEPHMKRHMHTYHHGVREGPSEHWYRRKTFSI